MYIFEGLYPTMVDQSYSRKLDQRVAAQEMPYGYDMPPPSADTHDYNQARLESHVEYKPKKKGY